MFKYLKITALSKAFAAVHEAQLRERQENLLCDHCPMRWFSQLCAEVEGNILLCDFLYKMLVFISTILVSFVINCYGYVEHY